MYSYGEDCISKVGDRATMTRKEVRAEGHSQAMAICGVIKCKASDGLDEKVLKIFGGESILDWYLF